MNVLLRATEIEGRPVVTLDGERVGDVKDVVFDSFAVHLYSWAANSEEIPWFPMHPDPRLFAISGHIPGPDSSRKALAAMHRIRS